MGFESVNVLIERARDLRHKNPAHAMSLLAEALAIAQLADYKEGMAKIIHDRAVCYNIQKKYKLAITAFNEAGLFYKDLNDKQGQLECLNEIGLIYCALGDFPSSMNYILQKHKIHTELSDFAGIANDFNDIGKLYIHLKEYENAIEYFKKALKIFEGLKDKNHLIHSYYLLGNAYNWQNDFDRALYYLLRASNSLEQLGDAVIQAKTLACLAILYNKLHEYDKSIIYFNQALAVSKEGGNPVVRAQIKKSLGKLYIDLTQYDKAIEVLNSTLESAQESPMEGQLVRIHQFLSVAYEKIGEHEKSLHHLKLCYELHKQVTSEEVNLKTKALLIKYDLEELKKQKEIAELSDKLKEQFLANISHEIRTPMNGVLGMAYLLSKTSPTQEQQEYIEAIKVSSNNLMVIISDILDFSKINAGKIEFNESEFNIRELVKGILQILRSKAEEKKINLGCTIDYNIQNNLKGDPIRLNQILMNLVGNAIKFTEKGRVQIDLKLIEQKENSCKLRIKVIDTGIGIPEGRLESIFESFEQADNNKRRYEGTGLGLTIVKQLVELQGGTVSVKSRINEGSEFTVDMVFQLAGNQNKTVEESPVEIFVPLDFSQINLLIVEDNKVNQLLLKNTLKKFGFIHSDTTENGREALSMLQEKNYDLILMDIQMPVMDGYEITREIRSRARIEMRQIPIIAITADASEKEKLKAKETGMNDYVVKPYVPEELYHTLLKYIKPADCDEHETKNKSLPARKNKEAGMELYFLEKFTGGDLDLTIQLIEIFLKQVPEAIVKLNHSISKRDWDETHVVAHKLKSSIAIFELQELKKLITNIEEFSRDRQNPDEIRRAFSAFREGSRHVIRNLEAELKKLKKVRV